jgi:hypothetical protein
MTKWFGHTVYHQWPSASQITLRSLERSIDPHHTSCASARRQATTCKSMINISYTTILGYSVAMMELDKKRVMRNIYVQAGELS